MFQSGLQDRPFHAKLGSGCFPGDSRWSRFIWFVHMLMAFLRMGMVKISYHSPSMDIQQMTKDTSEGSTEQQKDSNQQEKNQALSDSSLLLAKCQIPIG